MDIPEAYPIATLVWMVPCKIDPVSTVFKPITRPSNEYHPKNSSKSRNRWNSDEDSILQEIFKTQGPKNWSRVAKELNFKVHKAFPIRNGKQCRERWLNHFDPSLKQSPWSETEDFILVQKQSEIGNKWKGISQFLKGRPETQVKSRWKTLQKQRKKNKGIKQKFDDLVTSQHNKGDQDWIKKQSLLGFEIDFEYSLENLQLNNCVIENKKIELGDLGIGDIGVTLGMPSLVDDMMIIERGSEKLEADYLRVEARDDFKSQLIFEDDNLDVDDFLCDDDLLMKIA